MVDPSGAAAPEVSPFLKWAGGKRWLVHRLHEFLPKRWGGYFEPFLGSGAIYFSLLPENAFLSDVNSDLVATYQALSLDWQAVEDLLYQHQLSHCTAYYYYVRDCNPRSRIERAARFIYLNRACWNGLYRVNKAGAFNVPKGSKSRILLEGDDFESIASQLKSADFLDCDFEITVELAGRGDLLFVDPPYTVRHQYNGFVKYNESLFSWEDQIRLRDALCRAKRRGVKVLSTNADHASVRELYQPDFRVVSTTRFSPIGGQDARRGSFPELIIMSY